MKLWFFFTETLWGKGKGTQTSGTFGAIRSKEAVPPNNGEVISTLSVYLPALRFSFFSFCRHAYFTHPECVLDTRCIQYSRFSHRNGMLMRGKNISGVTRQFSFYRLLWEMYGKICTRSDIKTCIQQWRHSEIGIFPFWCIFYIYTFRQHHTKVITNLMILYLCTGNSEAFKRVTLITTRWILDKWQVLNKS